MGLRRAARRQALPHPVPQSGGYQVRLVDLATGKLASSPLKDPHESGTIWGQPFSRLASPDGRFLFTLYLGSNGGAMMHELDLKAAKARCIDLPGTGDYGSASSWALSLAPDGRTLWAVSPGYGRVVGIDVAQPQGDDRLQHRHARLEPRLRHERRDLARREAVRDRRRKRPSRSST